MTVAGEDLLGKPIRDIAAGYRSGELTPTSVTRAAFDRIAQTDPVVHAWVSLDHEGAQSAAKQAEVELNTGVDRGLLHGIPLGVKDIFDVAGWPTRCGSLARQDAQPANRDARSVAILRDAGAVLLGKTVTQEFAAGVISPPARNPWDPSRIPGGSSGGSAVAVALGNCFGALGSDTGGSIRIPASACGVVGFKPTFGQVSVDGVFPLSWSLDTVGPITRTADDAWVLWKALIGDVQSLGNARDEVASNLLGMRIGIPRPFFFDAVQAEVQKKVGETIERLRSLGAEVIEAPWGLAEAARASAFVINRVETAWVHENVAVGGPESFAKYGKDLRLRVAAGRTVPATLYLTAQRAREVVFTSMRELFSVHGLHALLVPALPTTALQADRLAIEGTGLDESIGAAWTRLTMPFNATGQPVLVIPAGHDGRGLPIGVRLAGEPGRESVLFRIGEALERAGNAAAVRPPLLDTLAATRGTESAQ